MGISYIDDKYLTQIANSIRAKVGGNTMISPPEMPDAILSISGEGSSSSAFWTVNITPTSHQTIQATITPAAKSGTSSFTLVESISSRPAIIFNIFAQSVTSLVIGPIWSKEDA